MYEKLPMTRLQARLQAWTLESRIRYALVMGGINVLIVGGMLVAFGSLSLPRDLLVVIPVTLVSVLVNGWVWYPRAKRKFTADADEIHHASSLVSRLADRSNAPY